MGIETSESLAIMGQVNSHRRRWYLCLRYMRWVHKSWYSVSIKIWNMLSLSSLIFHLIEKGLWNIFKVSLLCWPRLYLFGKNTVTTVILWNNYFLFLYILKCNLKYIIPVMVKLNFLQPLLQSHDSYMLIWCSVYKLMGGKTVAGWYFLGNHDICFLPNSLKKIFFLLTSNFWTYT